MKTRLYIPLLLSLILSACVTTPQVARDKSALTGIVTARPHSQILAKQSRDDQFIPSYDRVSGLTDGTIVDYDNLVEIYVGLIASGNEPRNSHQVTFFAKTTKPESLAIALGDTLRVHNASDRELTFFLAGTDSDAFQDLARIQVGATREFRIGIDGRLELTTDEAPDLAAHILARRGLTAVKIASGENYLFRDLTPGAYNVIFWNWRIGKLERSVVLHAGKVSRIDEVLSVDRTVR